MICKTKSNTSGVDYKKEPTINAQILANVYAEKINKSKNNNSFKLKMLNLARVVYPSGLSVIFKQIETRSQEIISKPKPKLRVQSVVYP